MMYILLLCYLICGSLGMVLTKYGGKQSELHILKSGFTANVHWLFMLGLVLYVISFILWIIVLQKFRLTYISPIAYGITFILLIGFSAVILHEKITTQQIIGAAMIIGGVIVASIPPK